MAMRTYTGLSSKGGPRISRFDVELRIFVRTGVQRPWKGEKIDSTVPSVEIVPRIALSASNTGVGIVGHHGALKSIPLSWIYLKEVYAEETGDHIMMKLEAEILQSGPHKAFIFWTECFISSL